MSTQAVIDGFTRQETLKLTDCTSSRLSYLEKVELIVPIRIGNNKRPTVLFSWEQLLEIRAIKNLRKEISLQTVRSVVRFLNENGFDDSLRDKQLAVIDDEVFWINSDWSNLGDKALHALKVAGKKKQDIGQYSLLVIPSFNEIVEDIWNNAQQSSSVINFESFKNRAKAQPA